MAGIGFGLQKILSERSYSNIFRAYVYSAIIASGPMMVGIISLLVIRAVTQIRLGSEESSLFMGLIIYNYAFSILGISPFMYIITRYLADKYYQEEIKTFTATYISLLVLVFTFQGLIAGVYLYWADLDLPIKWTLYYLYLFLSGIWLAMIFLSAAKNYRWIVGAFLVGASLGIIAAIMLGRAFGLVGFLQGYCLGQAICFFILSLRIFFEFKFYKFRQFEFLSYFIKYPYLALIGIFYFLGIWIDKIIFWLSENGERIGPGIYVFSNYDSPMFLAYLTTIPSMAFFLVELETSFLKNYKAYYYSIRNRESLSIIRERRQAIIQNLGGSFQKFVILQGVITGVMIILLYQIADALYLNPYQMGIFRIGLLGAFLQIAFLIVLNILFYFDFQKDVLLLCLLFVVCNILFTCISLKIGLMAYGFGFTGACFVSAFSAFLVLQHKLENLDYWSFMKQPIIVPKFNFELEKGDESGLLS